MRLPRVSFRLQKVSFWFHEMGATPLVSQCRHCEIEAISRSNIMRRQRTAMRFRVLALTSQASVSCHNA